MKKMTTITINGTCYQVTDVEAIHHTAQSLTAEQKAQTRSNIGAIGIDTLMNVLPNFSEKGNMVACNPIKGLPLDVTTHIPADGDGVTSLTLKHTGKNLWDFKSGMAQCLGKSGSTGADVIRYGYIVTLPPGSYTISGEALDGNNYVYFNPINLSTLVMGNVTNFIVGTKATTTKVTLAEGQGLYFYDAGHININATAEAAAKQVFYTNTNIQIEAGSRKTAYEPFCGEVKTVNFDAPITDGEYNWTTGKLTDAGGNITQLEPQESLGLLGANYLFSNTGTTEVSGKSDPNAIIQDIYSKLNALSATTAALTGV